MLFDVINGKTIGTTGNGIGSAYADVAIRSQGPLVKNILIGDYISNRKENKKIIEMQLKNLCKENSIAFNNNLIGEFDSAVWKLRKYVAKDPLVLQKLIDNGKNVFFEGANSTMLDPVYGNVPYVTSSRTLAPAAYVGGDINNTSHKKTIAVIKAIMSRVGNGPFVSEFGGVKSKRYCAEGGGNAHKKELEFSQYPNPQDLLKSKNMLKLGQGLRMIGGEYGATTKRPRRIGALDLVMLKQNISINGVDELYINKMDCLVDFKDTFLPGIPVVIGYKLKGKIIDYMPTSEKELRQIKPVYKYLPYITKNLTEIRSKKDLPKEVFTFISFVEKYVGVNVKGIGVGPERDQFVML